MPRPTRSRDLTLNSLSVLTGGLTAAALVGTGLVTGLAADYTAHKANLKAQSKAGFAAAAPVRPVAGSTLKPTPRPTRTVTTTKYVQAAAGAASGTTSGAATASGSSGAAAPAAPAPAPAPAPARAPAPVPAAPAAAAPAPSAAS